MDINGNGVVLEDGLRNKYYAFRHGQSRANVEGIIISNPTTGTASYGLTEAGRDQVAASALELRGQEGSPLIISSDFKRAAQTAEIICETLKTTPVIFDRRLRERFFGEFEGASHTNYSKAWKQDVYSAEQEFRGAESTGAVRERMWAVVQSLETQFSGRAIILVSHGDPLMILQTAFLELGPGKHRTLPYIETAGWRLLNP